MASLFAPPTGAVQRRLEFDEQRRAAGLRNERRNVELADRQRGRVQSILSRQPVNGSLLAQQPGTRPTILGSG